MDMPGSRQPPKKKRDPEKNKQQQKLYRQRQYAALNGIEDVKAVHRRRYHERMARMKANGEYEAFKAKKTEEGMRRYHAMTEERPVSAKLDAKIWICQAYFDFEAERIGIVIIVGACNGEGDGLDARQGGLKLHLPRGFVPIIHIGHVKQTERHDAVCSRCSTASSFYTLSLLPGFGLVGPQHLSEIPRAKNRAPFHTA